MIAIVKRLYLLEFYAYQNWRDSLNRPRPTISPRLVPGALANDAGKPCADVLKQLQPNALHSNTERVLGSSSRQCGNFLQSIRAGKDRRELQPAHDSDWNRH